MWIALAVITLSLVGVALLIRRDRRARRPELWLPSFEAEPGPAPAPRRERRWQSRAAGSGDTPPQEGPWAPIDVGLELLRQQLDSPTSTQPYTPEVDSHPKGGGGHFSGGGASGSWDPPAHSTHGSGHAHSTAHDHSPAVDPSPSPSPSPGHDHSPSVHSTTSIDTSGSFNGGGHHHH